MTSGYTPGSMPEKDQPGFDQILSALREGLNENPHLKEMPAEEVAGQLVLGQIEQESPGETHLRFKPPVRFRQERIVTSWKLAMQERSDARLPWQLQDWPLLEEKRHAIK